MQVRDPHRSDPARRSSPPEVRTDDLERALEHKTALLHEVDHRVKNNLQLISSLLLLQARRAGDPAVRDALKSAQARVNAVAIVHRRLFQGEDPGAFDVSDFIRDLVGDVIGVSGRGDLQARLDLERVDLPSNQAATLALLLGEIVGNSVRHAFPDGAPGVLAVTSVRENDHLRIEIADNGVGMPTVEPVRGFGRTIVALLCGQLHAECEAADVECGVRTIIRIPLRRTD